MICNKCGAENKEGAKFCTKCGNRLSENGLMNVAQQQEMVQVQQQSMPPVEQEEPMQQNWQEPLREVPKKGKGLIIALIIALAIAIIGVGGFIGYKIVSDKLQNEDSEDIDRSDDDEDDEDEVKEEETEEGSTQETDTDAAEPTVDENALLMDQLDQDLQMRGDMRNSEVDLYSVTSWDDFNENGIFGAAIADLNGDGQSELIEIYMESIDYYASAYADVYTIEDSGISKVADKVMLCKQIGYDDADICIYLKQNGNGYNLIGDTYQMYWRWADGGDWELYAYDGKDLKFDQISNFFMNGSAWDEDEPSKHLQAGVKAGLNVTEGMSNKPMALQDGDIMMICNISNTITADPEDFCGSNAQVVDMFYGTMQLTTYTNDKYEPDQMLTNSFLEKEEERYASNATSADYILPESDWRVLTESDLAGIINSPESLKLARNEIYARHGRKFKDATIQEYFNGKSWYFGTIEPDSFSDNMLSDIEIANRDLIVEVEKKVN